MRGELIQGFRTVLSITKQKLVGWDAMARRLDWDKARIDERMRHNGVIIATAGISSKSKQRRKRKNVQRAPTQIPRQAAAAQARAIAKKQKRLAEERRIQEARAANAAAKAARRAIHEAQMAAAQQRRRERMEAEAQRRADPEYQARQTAKVAARLTKRMKSVIVVKKGQRPSPLRTNTASSAKPPSPSRY